MSPTKTVLLNIDSDDLEDSGSRNSSLRSESIISNTDSSSISIAPGNSFYSQTVSPDVKWRRLMAGFFNEKSSECSKSLSEELDKKLGQELLSTGSKRKGISVDYISDHRSLHTQDAFLGAPVLLQVLSSCIIRHTKANIKEIPKPTRTLTVLKLSPQESDEYNSLVTMARSNLVTTEKDYTKSNGAHLDSLLHSRNRKNLNEVIRNCRLATMGAGRAKIILRQPDKNIRETIEILGSAIRQHYFAAGRLPHGMLPIVPPPAFAVPDDNADITSVTAIAGSSGASALGLQDAVKYIEFVKTEFNHKPDVFQEFLGIFKSYNEKTLSTQDVIGRVKNIFEDHADNLILGFNLFLPDDEQIVLSSSSNRSGISTSSRSRYICQCGGNCQLRFNQCDHHHTYEYIQTRLARVEAFIWDVVHGNMVTCDMCDDQFHLLMPIPCPEGHILCPDCLDDRGDYCDTCQCHFSWHDLQRLQPGFETSEFIIERPGVNSTGAVVSDGYGGQRTVEASPLLRFPLSTYTPITTPTNNTGTTGIGTARLLLSPALTLVGGAATVIPTVTIGSNSVSCRVRGRENEFGSDSSKVAHLIGRITQLERDYLNHINTKRCKSSHQIRLSGDGDDSGYDRVSGSDRVVSFAVDNDSTSSSTATSSSVSSSCPRIEVIGDSYCSKNKDQGYGKNTPQYFDGFIVPKVVVYSQFSPFLDRILLELKATQGKQRYGSDSSSRGGVNGYEIDSYPPIYFADAYHPNPKAKAQHLKKFRHMDSCRVLLLGIEGSHGLDLSFVTHIFLMDSILNNSLEKQVISRAYRMGARSSVNVDNVIAKGTVEEDIYKLHYNIRNRLSGGFGDRGSHADTDPYLALPPLPDNDSKLIIDINSSISSGYSEREREWSLWTESHYGSQRKANREGSCSYGSRVRDTKAVHELVDVTATGHRRFKGIKEPKIIEKSSNFTSTSSLSMSSSSSGSGGFLSRLLLSLRRVPKHMQSEEL